MDKQQAAKALFLRGDTQQQIADKLDISLSTVEKWSIRGNWSAKRVDTKPIFDMTNREMLLDIIGHNLAVLHRRVLLYQAENADTLISKEEIEALTRMYLAVKGSQTRYSDNVQLIRRSLEYIGRENLDAAKAAIPAFDKLLADLRKESE